MANIDDPHRPGDVTIETKDSYGAPEGDRSRSGKLDEFATSVRTFAQRLPDQINRAIESAQTVLQNRLNAITVHVDDESQRRIDQLVDSGIFRNRSESAAFLIAEGIKARGDLFNAIGSRIGEIERLRNEMRALVGGTDDRVD
jgi:hypothetical protein